MTADSFRHDRFPPWVHIDDLLKASKPFRFSVPGTPYAEVFGTGAPSVLGVRVHDDSRSDLPGSPLTAISIDRVSIDGSRFTQIETAQRHLQPEFYSLCCLFADRVQLQGLAPAEALLDVLGSMAELLARQAILSEEKQIGLYGELLLLRSLAAESSWSCALDAWLAPEAEQHDFSWHGSDLEVKTTTTERRTHVIHGLTQLDANPDRPLYLLSLQVTRVGDNGLSLPALVSEVTQNVDRDLPGRMSELERAIRAVGWRDEYSRLFRQLYVLRSEPALIGVKELPALVPATLTLPAKDLSRVSDVTYRLDVTGLGTGCDVRGATIVLPIGKERGDE